MSVSTSLCAHGDRPVRAVDRVQADLERARSSVQLAHASVEPADRYLAAHAAALRTAAVVLACRARPGSRATRRPRDAWQVMAEVAPELAGWARHFAATRPVRVELASGKPDAVTGQHADDLLRDAEAFLAVVGGRFDRRRG